MRLTSTQLAVRWKPLSLEEARGFITHYTVTADPASNQRRQQAEGAFSVQWVLILPEQYWMG